MDLFHGEHVVDRRENLEDLVEAGDFENWANVFLKSDDGEFAAVSLDVLHATDEHRQAGAVDECYFGKIDNDVGRSFRGHAGKRAGDSWGNMKINFASEGDDIWGFWTRGRTVYFVTSDGQAE